jgi:hypothetical protein
MFLSNKIPFFSTLYWSIPHQEPPLTIQVLLLSHGINPSKGFLPLTSFLATCHALGIWTSLEVGNSCYRDSFLNCARCAKMESLGAVSLHQDVTATELQGSFVVLYEIRKAHENEKWRMNFQGGNMFNFALPKTLCYKSLRLNLQHHIYHPNNWQKEYAEKDGGKEWRRFWWASKLQKVYF